jgi:hypothetical protein
MHIPYTVLNLQNSSGNHPTAEIMAAVEETTSNKCRGWKFNEMHLNAHMHFMAWWLLNEETLIIVLDFPIIFLRIISPF